MRSFGRRVRTVLGLALIGYGLALAVAELVQRFGAWRDAPTVHAYPNEWGVRTRPLTRAETRAARARELEIARDLARTFGGL